MFEFINDLQLKAIASALLNNENYSFNENGLSILAKSSENGYSIQMSYSEPKEDLVKKEKEDFKKWLEGLDDDLFTGICDFMGQDEISNISNCLGSDDLETFRAGMLKFKIVLQQMLSQFTQISLTLANLKSNVSTLLKERELLIKLIEVLTRENEQLRNGCKTNTKESSQEIS